MRGFNNKIKSVYQELTNSKEKFGSFHKTLIHLHTPVSYDYKLFSNWTATKYRKITEDELYDIFFDFLVILIRLFFLVQKNILVFLC